MTRFVSALRRAPHLRITGERQRLLASFAAVFLFGLLAHGYAFTGLTLSHDSLNEMFLSGDIHYAAGSVADWKISLGRFLYPAFSRSSGCRLRYISFRGCFPWTVCRSSP